MRSFSSICLNSCLDRLCLLIGVGLDTVPLFSLSCVRKVGCPSTVLNIGFRSPLLSNSWAEIFRTGVVAPELHLEWLVPCVGDVTMSTLFEEFEVACEINHASTTCRVAFLQEKRNLFKNISLYGWEDVRVNCNGILWSHYYNNTLEWQFVQKYILIYKLWFTWK